MVAGTVAERTRHEPLAEVGRHVTEAHGHAGKGPAGYAELAAGPVLGSHGATRS